MRAALVLSFLILSACGKGAQKDPFAGGGRGGEGGATDVGEAGSDDGGAPPLAGGEPCVDDDGCNDGHDCTLDACDKDFGRCRHEPDHSVCDNGRYCDGSEKCDLKLGCVRGPAITCSDEYTCTIDTCIEETHLCTHDLRDADGDGEPPISCTGGDCNDFDPLVSSKASERCGNDVDDDCDGEVDEDGCVMPLYDRCGDALEIDAPGSYAVSTQGAAKDYAISCEQEFEDQAFRELVVGITVPGDAPKDVDIVATIGKSSPRLKSGELVLAATDKCGKPSDETACVESVVSSKGDAAARLVLRNAAPGAHAVYVSAARETDIELHVDFREPTPAPENETCGTSAPLVPGVPVTVLLADVTADLETRCAERTGELVYHFDLSEPSDVRLGSVALDDYGAPVVSLRGPDDCSDEAELTCRVGDQSELFARNLPAGSYSVTLSGTGPAEVQLVLAVSKPTEPPATEGCSAPPALNPGVTENVSLDDATDSIEIGCLVGAPDAAYSFALDEPSDVMLVQSGSNDDEGGVLIARAPCSEPEDSVVCASSDAWPVRAVAHDLEPGSWRAAVETAAGNPTSLTLLERPAAGSTFVQFADECEDALDIPETGGRFEGNTGNQYAQYDASCDFGGQSPGGAAEQMLKLTLTEPRRVVVDSSFSSYTTLVVVRDAGGCPGEEIADTCRITYTLSTSDQPHYGFVDTVLDAGSYFIQIDGYNGAKGRWVLEVFTAKVSED